MPLLKSSILALIAFYALPSFAEKKRSNMTWQVGLSGNRHLLKAGDGNQLVGNSGGVSFGAGYIADFWYFLGGFDILQGPYDPARNDQFIVDYSGTGLTAWVGFSAQTTSLRTPEGGYGFALGAQYGDMVGTSSGKNRQENSQSDERLMDNYSMRLTNFSLMPALFFSWLRPDRPSGNKPEQLKTRLDGLILTFGISLPLISRYSAGYERRTEPGAIVRETGSLFGYTVELSLTALLGT